ncbi:MAG: hypothetical protein J0L95_16290 [Candidatus Accumulibacter sp.]|jgi:hypothetical protein|uniref:hypothetical protein n=1 Tax=Accumulibacter sp. TaxID=2053492 RepID=UPI001ACC54B7|nr:hypothetical protein [Accumulibacter sp.]MBN8439581.1 hypothetical protein [Accumulibacter sp.]
MARAAALKYLGLTAGLLFCTFVWAADACRPLVVMPINSILQFDRRNLEVDPRLEATLEHDLTLVLDPGTLGLEPKAGVTELEHPVLVKDQILGRGVLTGDKGVLTFDFPEKSGATMVGSGDRRFSLGIRDRQPVAADGRELEVSPVLTLASSFILPAKTKVTTAGVGKVVVTKGTKLIWTLDSDPSLAFSLLRSVYLEEISALTPAPRLTVVKPVRVPPGSPLTVQVSAAGFDFRTKPVTFCFEGLTRDGTKTTVASGNGKFLSQSGDIATFEVSVPTEAFFSSMPQGLQGDAMGLTWRDRLIGTSLSVRAIGFDAGKVVVDAAGSFTLSNAMGAVLAGLLVLLMTFAISGWMMKALNPADVIRNLVINASSGRYSLSNLQILLWTLLVIFALSYAWFSTGVLLPLSSGILVLLGISGATSILARMAEGTDNSSAEPATKPMLKDLVWSEKEGFDLLRFQMLGFTLFTWSYSLVSVLRNEGLPEIPENLYTLMGISNAAYIGGKLPNKPLAEAPSPTQPSDVLTDAERSLGEADIRTLQSLLGISASGKIDSATRESVSKFKLEHGVAPVNGLVDRLLIEKVAAEATPAI